MGLFGMFNNSAKARLEPDTNDQAEAIIRQMAPEVFPRGFQQVLSESAELEKYLGCELSQKELVSIYARSKALVFIAKDKTINRCATSIYRNADNRLSLKQAEAIFDFACGRLGYNYSGTLTSCRHFANLFKTEISIDNESARQATRGSFNGKTRIVTLPEQNRLPYLVAYGSVLSAIMSGEYPELRKRLEDCVLGMIVCDGISESEYSDANFSLSAQLIHDAVGNRFLEYQVWEGIFQHMLSFFQPSSHGIIEKLRDSSLKVIKAIASSNSLTLFSADQFIGNPKELGKEVSWVVAMYAHEIKAGN